MTCVDTLLVPEALRLEVCAAFTPLFTPPWYDMGMTVCAVPTQPLHHTALGGGAVADRMVTGWCIWQASVVVLVVLVAHALSL